MIPGTLTPAQSLVSGRVSWVGSHGWATEGARTEQGLGVMEDTHLGTLACFSKLELRIDFGA